MVDRTNYDPDKVPDLALRQIFGRQRLDPALCKLMADSKLLTVDMFAMLGESITGVKTTLLNLVPDKAKFGPDDPAVELALTSLAAVWKTCSVMQEQFATRRAKMEEDPSKVPEMLGDDHAEFREQFVARHPAFFSHTIVNPIASSWKEFRETTWFTVLFLSMRWGRSELGVRRSSRSQDCPRMRKICLRLSRLISLWQQHLSPRSWTNFMLSS